MKFARTFAERNETIKDSLGKNITIKIPELIIEVIDVDSIESLSTMFHKDVVSEFKPVNENAQVGWIMKNGEFVQPPEYPPMKFPEIIGELPVSQLGAINA